MNRPNRERLKEIRTYGDALDKVVNPFVIRELFAEIDALDKEREIVNEYARQLDARLNDLDIDA